MSEFKETIENAELFTKHFVDPAVERMGNEIRSQLAPLVNEVENLKKQVGDHDLQTKNQGERIGKLEGGQKKALVGWGVFATIGSIVVGAAWGWVKVHVLRM